MNGCRRQSEPVGIDRERIARAVLDDPRAEVLTWRVETIPNAFGTPTTESIERVTGTARSGDGERPFSAIVKTVRSIRLFAPVAALPVEVQAAADAALPWQIEPEVYASGLHGGLPPELRAPRLYAVEAVPGDRARIWIEDVVARPIDWDLDTYAAAAFALGRLAGRYPSDAIPWSFTRMNFDFHAFLENRIGRGVIPGLADETTWTRPVIRDSVDSKLRADLFALWGRAHELVALTDPLPRTLAHGDACPQNLFGGESPGSFVAIDWGLTGVGPVGADVTQLLAGRIEAGELDPDELGSIEAPTVEAYRRGLAIEGMSVPTVDLARCVDATLVLRCVFTALPLERLPTHDAASDPATLDFFDKRARWCRLLVDRGQALLASRDSSG